MITTTNFTLIDQHNDFIVINKKAGINFHDEDNLGAGLFNQVKKKLNLTQLYPVHRLDKMTSGLVIMATSLSAAQQFQTLFADHQVKKYYLALSDKKPKKKQGLIKGDMKKSRRGTYKLMRSQTNPAISQFFSSKAENSIRVFIIKPHSGKTHQIRVALNSLGSPIIGDPSYYASSIADRGYLHAFALQFKFNDKNFSYICQPNTGNLFSQENIKAQIIKWSSPWQLDWPKL